MELYALSHCPEQAQRWPEYDFSQVLMIASESVLSRDWERPEEEEAWAHL